MRDILPSAPFPLPLMGEMRDHCSTNNTGFKASDLQGQVDFLAKATMHVSK